MMNAGALLSVLTRRGVRLEPRLHVEAPTGELTSTEREALRLHKLDLLRALLDDDATIPSAEPERRNPSTVTPDSRHPLVAPEVRAKIEAVESEARRLGWPAELLWNGGGFWNSPRGLAAVLDPEDEIDEVTPDYIAVLKSRRDLLRFYRRAG